MILVAHSGICLFLSLFGHPDFPFLSSLSALGVLVGCSVTNPHTAIEFLPAIFMPQILFSGFFVPPGLIPVWLSWIRYICPLTYGVKILVAAEYGNGRCDGLYPNFCESIFENVGVKENDVWWYYLVLIGLFVVVRILALFILKRKADQFY